MRETNLLKIGTRQITVLHEDSRAANEAMICCNDLPGLSVRSLRRRDRMRIKKYQRQRMLENFKAPIDVEAIQFYMPPSNPPEMPGTESPQELPGNEPEEVPEPPQPDEQPEREPSEVPQREPEEVPPEKEIPRKPLEPEPERPDVIPPEKPNEEPKESPGSQILNAQKLDKAYRIDR